MSPQVYESNDRSMGKSKRRSFRCSRADAVPSCAPLLPARILLGRDYGMPHMKTAVAAPTSARSTIAPSILRAFGLSFALLAVVWVEIVRHLAAEWNLNPQYGYG